MIHAAILALDSAPLSSIALPADILNAAGTLWNKMMGQSEEPRFRVSIVSQGGGPVSCYRSVALQTTSSLETLSAPDIIILGGLGDLEGFQEKNQHVLEGLKEFHAKGTILASICTGSFLLAATGLLNGRNATTHWGLAGLFSHLFPEVILRSDKTVVDERSLLSSGGTTAGADLSLYLVRRWCGIEVAAQTARVLLLDPYRSSQAPYEMFHGPIDHGDQEILKGQQWINNNYDLELTVDGLADQCRLSRRTFERRFKKATGDSPLRYIQRIRIEKAKELLEHGNLTFDTITSKVGYEDVSSFRRMFQKVIGLPPSVYREKFRKNEVLDEK